MPEELRTVFGVSQGLCALILVSPWWRVRLLHSEKRRHSERQKRLCKHDRDGIAREVVACSRLGG